MVLIALPPHPPTPITLIFAALLKLLANSIAIYTSFSLEAMGYGQEAMGNKSYSLSPIASRLFLKKFFYPPLQPVKQLVECLPIPPFKHCCCCVFLCIENKPHSGRIHRALYNINKSAYAGWQALSHREIKDLFSQFNHAFHAGCAAGKHYAGCYHIVAACLCYLLIYQLEKFLYPRLNNLSQIMSGNNLRIFPSHTGYF